MAQSTQPDAPPQLQKLIQLLNSREVRYVIVGSVAAQLYGVDVHPGDFDITPALDHENLVRLAQVLVEIEAVLPASAEIG